MTIQDTQTILQPELVNRLERKISYLSDLQSAIKNNQISQVYQLLDPHKFNDNLQKILSETSVAQLDSLVADIKKDIAAFLAPELINYVVTNFDFLTLEPVADDTTLYDVYIGDWWDHRQLGTLNVLTVVLTSDDSITSELIETAKLSDEETLNATKIQEVKKVITGLESFLADNTKRSLELQVIEDQLAEISANKSGLFGRSDKVTREALEKKQELLIATQKRMPEVEEKLNKQQAYLLRFEKEDALRQLELQAISAYYVDVPTFITELQHIYVSYMTKLDQK
ncbi:hydrolase [Leuconostoc gelidum subsp. gelidum]|uniref:Hydrolase n=1 Tax=Leuconostoc gelidum subsp. gelidum TaxID=1607839 RepID=A0AB35FYV2_LEUGE|nr:hydrolase [Leuconostoc gelidum]MBZ5963784.1 hydrolase [Leuconostoc gelidum subsp. gelidum]MBZ5975373.1 hydrolase [Leuconostoc gelidum subsp. gelidum]MBZ5976456.1 hydrolase [Leuconostoc gelidum subsp. gelidum]MBZ5985503.1 hydrolase [Leuconostoc gelidum subsp. gelidum]MBZ6000438.1 hydrolase [Leuconostoc gelidum subsp. gelidum]